MDAFNLLADLGDRSAGFRDALLQAISQRTDATIGAPYRDLLHQCFPSATVPAPVTGAK